MQREARYDSVTIWLHWATAGLIVALWLGAQIIDLFGRGAPEMYLRSLHVTLGVTLACVLAFRVVWRLTGARGPAVRADLLETAAHLLHYVLYALAGVVVVLGALTVWMQGDTIWNLFTIPAYDPANVRALGREMRGWHGLAANTILILAGLHAAAALGHHYLLRDNVLRRMLPGE